MIEELNKEWVENYDDYDDSLAQESIEKDISGMQHGAKPLGKKNFNDIDHHKKVSQTVPNSKLKPKAIGLKTAFPHNRTKKNNTKRDTPNQEGAALEIKADDLDEMKHQDVTDSHSAIITLAVAIPVLIALFLMVWWFSKRRKKNGKKNGGYNLLRDSDDKLHPPGPSISSGKTEAALAVDFVNAMEKIPGSTGSSVLANHGEGDSIKDIAKRKNKESGFSFNLPPISLLCYNGFFPSTIDASLQGSDTAINSGGGLHAALEPHLNFITANHTVSVNRLSEDSFSPNVSSISNSGLFQSEICLKIKDASLLKKDTPESETRKSSMKKKPSYLKEPSDFGGGKRIGLKTGEEVSPVDSIMSFTTACTTLEEVSKTDISERINSDHCNTYLYKNTDYLSNPDSLTKEVKKYKSNVGSRLKFKNCPNNELFSESGQEDESLRVSDKLKQASPLQIKITCLAYNNNVSDSNVPKTSKLKSSSELKSSSPFYSKSHGSKVISPSVFTQTSYVNLRRSNNDKCHQKTSKAQKICRVERGSFLKNHTNSSVKNSKNRCTSCTGSSSKSGDESILSTRKILEIVRNDLYTISEEEKNRTRKDKMKGDEPFNLSISKSKFNPDEVNVQNEEKITKDNSKYLNTKILHSTSNSSEVQPENIPVCSDSMKFRSSNDELFSSSSSKFRCGRTPYNTEHSGFLSPCSIHSKPLKEMGSEREQRATRKSFSSYFKCGKTELESSKNHLSSSSATSKFDCGKTPNNTEFSHTDSSENIRSNFKKQASPAIVGHQRNQSRIKGSLETSDSVLDCSYVRPCHIEEGKRIKSYKNYLRWNNLKELTHSGPGTSVTSSCSMMSSPPGIIRTTECSEELKNNDVVYNLRIPSRHPTYRLSTESSAGCHSSILKYTKNNQKLSNSSKDRATPSELSHQILDYLESTVTEPQKGGHLTPKSTSTSKTVRFSNDKDTHKSSSSSTIHESNSFSGTETLGFPETSKVDQVFSSNNESYVPIIPEIRVYKKI